MNPLETRKRLFSNTALLSGAEAVTQLANFGFVVCLARGFGSELLGTYAFATALGTLLTIFAGLGTHAFALRMLSREPARVSEVTGALVGYQTLVSVVVILGTLGATRWLGADSVTVWAVTLVVSYRILAHLTHLFILGYNARQDMTLAAALPVARRTIALALAGSALLLGAGPPIVLASLPVAALLGLIVAALLASRRFGAPRPRLRLSEIGYYLRGALPFFWVAGLATLYSRLGVVYLALLGGEELVGLFASAERLVAAVGVAPLMFSAALFPLISRLWTEERARFAELTQQAGRLVLFLTLPVATLLALFARDIIWIVYGNEFGAAAGLLRAVAWLLVLRGVSQLLTTAGQAADQQRILVVSKGLGLALLTLASLILIPVHGAMGLVLAMLMSELASALSNYVLLRRAGVPVMSLKSIPRVAAACLLAVGLALLVDELSLWLRLLVVTAGGAGALWSLGAVGRHDLRYARAILATPHRQQSD